mgnify:CR=1 FL=1
MKNIYLFVYQRDGEVPMNIEQVEKIGKYLT